MLYNYRKIVDRYKREYYNWRDLLVEYCLKLKKIRFIKIDN